MSVNPTAAGSLLPKGLRALGWTLERKVLNDDEENPEFIARNATLELVTGPCKNIEAAIDAANSLQPNPTTKPGVEKLAASLIRTDGGTQPREELDLDVVDDYGEAMLAGDVFPPVTLFFDGKHYWLADGFHRLFAHKKQMPKLGLEIDAEIFQGTKRDAVLYSLGANARHGLPRSPDDKRVAVQKLLTDPEWSQWSDSLIAQTANVSQPFVSKRRRALPLIDNEPEAAATQNVLSEEVKDAAPASPAPRRGADNRVINTAKIGKTPRTVTPAQRDIAFSSPSTETKKSASTTNELGRWENARVLLTITIHPGKGDKRKVAIAGQVGDGTPIFRSGFTLFDLVPLPGAVVATLGDIQKAFAKSGAKARPAKPTKSVKKKLAPKKAAPKKAAKKKPAKARVRKR